MHGEGADIGDELLLHLDSNLICTPIMPIPQKGWGQESVKMHA